jgi:hypothetical protein
MAESTATLQGGHETCFGCTNRKDSWWLGPTATVLGFGLFIVYSTWAAFQGEHYYWEPYLSPFYSPVLLTDAAQAGAVAETSAHGLLEHHSWFGGVPGWWPGFLPFSPAFLILAFPGSFRFTCYYYRKAYYRAFAQTPTACAVGPIGGGLSPTGKYRGETALMLFQNLHRYALYFALIFIGILYYDAFVAFHHPTKGWGVGVGSLVLTINATLLACYTFGCHSFRHLVGGRLNWFSKSPGRHTAWKGVTFLNERHMLFAWLSLFWVGFSDVYVRLVSMEIIPDLNTWGI